MQKREASDTAGGSVSEEYCDSLRSVTVRPRSTLPGPHPRTEPRPQTLMAAPLTGAKMPTNRQRDWRSRHRPGRSTAQRKRKRSPTAARRNTDEHVNGTPRSSRPRETADRWAPGARRAAGLACGGTAPEHGVSLWDKENVLELVVMRAAQLRHYESVNYTL